VFTDETACPVFAYSGGGELPSKTCAANVVNVFLELSVAEWESARSNFNGVINDHHRLRLEQPRLSGIPDDSQGSTIHQPLQGTGIKLDFHLGFRPMLILDLFADFTQTEGFSVGFHFLFMTIEGNSTDEEAILCLPFLLEFPGIG
jgi:hypothetical protein